MTSFFRSLFGAVSLLAACHLAQAQTCNQASDACIFAQPLGQGDLHLRYYASQDPQAPTAGTAPTELIVAIHGHSHDANKTFDAALKTVALGGRTRNVLVVAPIFQAAARDAARCSTPGVPGNDGSEPSWSCSSWIDGAPAVGQGVTSYHALDLLVAAVLSHNPSIKRVTVAGFSAGAQTTQHYLTLAAPLPAGVAARFVVADPGTWLYFDAVRPAVQMGNQPGAWSDCRVADGALSGCALSFVIPPVSSCADYNHWKYGLDGLPERFATSADDLRARYSRADVRYLEGGNDEGSGPGTAARVLDKSCGADLQGPDRLHRGLAYAAYDSSVLQSRPAHHLKVVPGCAHDVACVLPTPAGAQALFSDDF